LKTVCEVLGVSRSNLAVKLTRPADWVDQRKKPALDDVSLVAELRKLVAELPTYGYRRAWALLRRSRDALCQPRVNAKRVYRVMRGHGLLLERRPRYAPSTRRHDGKIAVDRATCVGARTVSNSAAMMVRRCAWSLPWTAATAKR